MFSNNSSIGQAVCQSSAYNCVSLFVCFLPLKIQDLVNSNKMHPPTHICTHTHSSTHQHTHTSLKTILVSWQNWLSWLNCFRKSCYVTLFDYAFKYSTSSKTSHTQQSPVKPSESVQEKNWDGKGVIVCTVEVLFSNTIRLNCLKVSKFNLKPGCKSGFYFDECRQCLCSITKWVNKSLCRGSAH